MAAIAAGELREGVRKAYSAAAERPRDTHPFPVGRGFAESVGYPAHLLLDMPAVCSDRFAGVSNVSVFADIPTGSTVLELGCGAGLDSLIAARRVGPGGQVFGFDFSPAMLRYARQGAAEAGADNVTFYEADVERLPVDDGSVDVVLVNGVFNLNPDRSAIFGALARVVRRDGVVYAAELILKQPLPEEALTSEVDWFA